MRSDHRIRILGTSAVLALLIGGTGCASRGYVRTQVGESANALSARIDDNREGIERTQQDLARVETVSEEATETNLTQDRQIRETQAQIQTAQSAIASVRTVAETAGRVAGSADDRSTMLVRMFEDRGRLGIGESHEIYFAFGSATIDDTHAVALEAVRDHLKQDPDAILVLEGRTDSTGDPLFNEQLGQKRVDATKNYLVLEMGVPVYRIHGFSYGEARPEYDNEVPDERQKNRSVKLLILTPNSPATTVAALPE